MNFHVMYHPPSPSPPPLRPPCRTEGGIPPLVDLLESTDAKVQRAGAGALRTLAFKNEQNKNQVGEVVENLNGMRILRRTVQLAFENKQRKNYLFLLTTGIVRTRWVL